MGGLETVSGYIQTVWGYIETVSGHLETAYPPVCKYSKNFNNPPPLIPIYIAITDSIK